MPQFVDSVTIPECQKVPHPLSICSTYYVPHKLLWYRGLRANFPACMWPGNGITQAVVWNHCMIPLKPQNCFTQFHVVIPKGAKGLTNEIISFQQNSVSFFWKRWMHDNIIYFGWNLCTLPNDQQFNLEFQFKSIFKLEFHPEFGFQLGIPILMGINLGECGWIFLLLWNSYT